jgi:hypothetical protein
MNPKEIEAAFRSDTTALTESHRFAQDKLIAVVTAIMGFTILLLGSDKLSLLNLCLVKVSWMFFGFYLLLAFGAMWSSISLGAQNAMRNAIIRLDESSLSDEKDEKRRNEKQVLIGYLKIKDYIDREYWKKSKRERKADKTRGTFRLLWEKYKDDINAINILKDQDMDKRTIRDRLVNWFFSHSEWSYVSFAIGLLCLILSALF